MNTKQLVNRLLQIVLVLFGISFLTFCLTYLSPGDPAELMLVAGGTVPSEELLAETREQMGLNDRSRRKLIKSCRARLKPAVLRQILA